ncbi:murein hydrolase activator EnvC family protein [Alicyclobacillus shizuokensis]|uniref:murein hydrolase activator EnvC family protein n=1 Tax=Alicyclobacillus shizuokensis TaxID=392014 RepID=UPI0008347DAB|nr:hypothetical protein [Alicyclobacillus shizuokensis]
MTRETAGSSMLLKLAAATTAACLLTGSLGTEVYASTLSKKQQEMVHLQKVAHENAKKLAQERKQVERLKQQVHKTRQEVSQLSQQIDQNQSDIKTLQEKVAQLYEQMARTQDELTHARENVASMLRATYEYGNVPLIEVLFNASSWSDLLSRVQTISAVTEQEHQSVVEIQALQRQLRADEAQQQQNVNALIQKGYRLLQMKQAQLQLEQRQQKSLVLASRGIASLVSKQKQLQDGLNLTNSQIQQLEAQTEEQERILAIQLDVGEHVVPKNLRYQNLPIDKLYAYVRQQGSTFTRSDIATICAAARRYDVNPALLIAITGQEQAFVPPGPDADLIRNNPFNVFYSWQVYNTTLTDAANIAADTVRHKLSVPPPKGEDAILWINDPRNPWGIYATDPHWAFGVKRFFNDIMAYVQ